MTTFLFIYIYLYRKRQVQANSNTPCTDPVPRAKNQEWQLETNNLIKNEEATLYQN